MSAEGEHMGFIIDDESKRWPNGVIPYVITPKDFPPNSVGLAAIGQAIAIWQSATPIRLVPRNAQNDYRQFTFSATACQTPLGRQGGTQFVSCALGEGGGFTGGNIAHEIGHAIGFIHEHQRPDRDAVVA